MRALVFLAGLAVLAACANVNASGDGARVGNPSCLLLCFGREHAPGPVDPDAPTARPRWRPS